VQGGDPRGQRLAVREVPDSVRTYGDWCRYRYEVRLGPRADLEHVWASAEEPAEGRYERWLERLPVADLYLGYLATVDSDWEKLEDDSFELPAELVARLRRLARSIDVWLRRGRFSTRPDYTQWLEKWGDMTGARSGTSRSQ
jgi:hypothetical protein